jgi:hypothetical protein
MHQVRELASASVYKSLAEQIFTTLSTQDGVLLSLICLLKVRTYIYYTHTHTHTHTHTPATRGDGQWFSL